MSYPFSLLMISFTISLVVLIAGFFIYGKITERIFGIEKNRPTPATVQRDNVDYVPMKPWKIFFIQFLNIAGLGPIFGAIMGASFGPASFIWIVLGTLFAGCVHDYFSGMMSLRHNGESLPEIHGRYLGKRVRNFMRIFTIVMMILVGAVFVAGPAGLLAMLTPEWLNTTFWIVIIFLYYIVATLFPVDKIIGKIYPVFGICLLIMAFGIMIMMYVKQPAVPEFWQGLHNRSLNSLANPIFPMMFVSIACGAISGFHATQSPLMARCMTNEKYGRPVFLGSMVAEGILALIWAAAACYFFFEDPDGIAIFKSGETNAAVIVNYLTAEWLGPVGTLLAMLGVIAAPITTGDTAFRSARIMVSEVFHIDQKPLKNRLLISFPLFAAGLLILVFSLADAKGFNTIWRYFAWSNQTLAVVTLWSITVFLYRDNKPYLISMIPALFMTMVVTTFIFISPTGFGLSPTLSYFLGGIITLAIMELFHIRERNLAAKSAPCR